MNSSMKRLPLIAAALVLTAGVAVATEEPKSTPTPAPEATAPAPAAQPSGDGLAGAKVGIDPKTGELRGLTAAEDAELEAQMKAFWAQFSGVPHTVKSDKRNKRKSYVVAPTHMRATMARIGPDGKVVYDCFDADSSAKDVRAALEAKAAETKLTPEVE